MKTLNSVLQFIGGIALVIVGILTFFSDLLTLDVVSYIVVYAVLVYGVLQIALVFKSDEKSRFGHLILGILLIAFGILALYNMSFLKINVLVAGYVFIGMAFIIMFAASLTNILTNFKEHNFIISIILIILNILLVIFSISIYFFDPVLELEIISIFISLSILTAGFSEIGNAFNKEIV